MTNSRSHGRSHRKGALVTQSAPEPPAARPVSSARHIATCFIFATLFIGMEMYSSTRESATYDEPVHLADGYFALHGDFRTDPEHPPLLRAWAALPLLVLTRVSRDANAIDRSTPGAWPTIDLFNYAHHFLYVENDADRLLYRARVMIMLLGVALGVLVYAWAFELWGWNVAVGVLALYALEPNLVSHARLVTTDIGMTLFFAAAVYFFWRSVRSWSAVNVIAASVSVAAAANSKYSALLLGPVLVVLLVYANRRRHLAAARAAVLVVAAGAATILAVWAAYGFRYEPSASPGWRYAFHREAWAQESMPATAQALGWIDEHRLLPNGFTQGLLLNRYRSSGRGGFLAGRYSESGRWYYFPIAFLLKTPLTLMTLAVIGLFALRRSPDQAAYLLIPILVYMGWAMTARINIGLRHVLPIYPFVILSAGAAMHAFASRWRHLVPVAGVLMALEAATVYPHTLAFFNQAAGGPARGSEYLTDSNLDWGQDLKGLKRWMTEHDIPFINLAYFGVADPRYYGIECQLLPGAPGWVPFEAVGPPKLPGYVAVSATFLRGYGETESQRRTYAGLVDMQPVATIGHSIFVYWVTQRWW